MKTSLLRNKFGFCALPSATLPMLLALMTGAGTANAALPPAHDLVGLHFEFSDFDGPQDYLIWQGSSPSYLILRAVDGQPATVTEVPGGTLMPTVQFVFQPIAPPTVISTYQIFPSEGGAASNHISTQELFDDPGFAAGTENTWTQLTTPDGGWPDLTNFIQGEPGNHRAVLGLGTSRTDEIYTSSPMFISDGRRKLNTASLTISGECAVNTEESPDETIAYDSLDVEIRSADTGRILATRRITDNRNGGNTAKVRFNVNLDYHDFYGQTVIVTFRAHNDEIFTTTFSLEHVEFDLVLNYRT